MCILNGIGLPNNSQYWVSEGWQDSLEVKHLSSMCKTVCARLSTATGRKKHRQKAMHKQLRFLTKLWQWLIFTHLICIKCIYGFDLISEVQMSLKFFSWLGETYSHISSFASNISCSFLVLFSYFEYFIFSAGDGVYSLAHTRQVFHRPLMVDSKPAAITELHPQSFFILQICPMLFLLLL